MTGQNEDQVMFNARQIDRTLSSVANTSSKEVTFKAKTLDDVKLCWVKTDHKSKMVTFIVS